uniref:SH3 domain-containing protein n=1 Tax=Globodera pallida TaxID=36090 RepID=A0A183C2K3_GLOPA
MIRRSTEFSRECSASSVVSTTTKLQLVGGNRHREDLGTSNLALNLPYGNCAALSDPCPLRPPPPLLGGVSLLHASDKVTVLPASKPPSSTGERLWLFSPRAASSLMLLRPNHPFRFPMEDDVSANVQRKRTFSSSPMSLSPGNIISGKPPEKPPRQFHYQSVEQLVAPTMPLLPSSVGTVSASSPPASSAAASPSARPLRVAQPPPLATAFPSCSSSIPSNSVDAPSSYLPSFISAPSLPKTAVPFHRSVASVSSELGGHLRTMDKQQLPVGSIGRGDRGRSRFGQMSYEELLELARNQQRQIETNEEELDERRKAVALFGVAKRTAASQTEQQQNARILMANLRAQISRDELEMLHLGVRQKEAKKLREHNERQNRDLGQLEAEYAHDEEQLRRAVAKVDSLRRQLEMLYQRRAVAMDAAISRQRQINGEGRAAENGNGRVEKRPKASIQENVDQMAELSKGGGRDGSDGEQRNKSEGGQSPLKSLPSHLSTLHPTFQPPINWRKTSPQVDQFSIKRNSMTALKRLSWVAENGGDEYLLHFVVNEQKKGRTHISFGEMVPKSSMDTMLEMPEKERIRANENADGQRKVETDAIGAFRQPKGVIGGGGGDQLDVPVLGERTTEERDGGTEEKQTKTLSPEEKRTHPDEKKTNLLLEGSKSYLELEGNQTDLEKMREAAKGPSPVKRMAVQENSWEFHKKFAERLADKAIKEKEQNLEEEEEVTEGKKSESDEEDEIGEKEATLCTSPSGQVLQWTKGQLLNEWKKIEEKGNDDENERKKNEEEKGRKKSEDESGGKKSEDENEWKDENGRKKSEEEWENERKKEADEGKLLEELEVSVEIVPKTEGEVVEKLGELFGSPPPDEMTTDESSSSVGEDAPILFEESSLALPFHVKSILRRPDTVREVNKRKVMFDLIVLFLDVAYEGQYDTLVELASKIENISISNSEGTTALHYAICAGNVDIVTFLIESGADVNALDVDGWSPLHCAASCNNPKMLRQLIENGACPFATTFGMSETATQLFDETLDFAIAADYMEIVENCMGVLNDGKVYAAYAYESENADELTFSEGDELRVLRKSEGAEDGSGERGERGHRDGAAGDSNDGEGDGDGEEESDQKQHFWWLCEHCPSGDKGLAPRNYLGLYPTWKFRSRYPTNFELPRPSRSIADRDSDGGGEKQQELSTYA